MSMSKYSGSINNMGIPFEKAPLRINYMYISVNCNQSVIAAQLQIQHSHKVQTHSPSLYSQTWL